VWPPHAPRELKIEKALPEYVREMAEKSPNRVALNFYGREITYSEFNDFCNRLANGLIRLGVKKGDRVALHMQNCPQFPIGLFGALRAGAVVVALNPMFKQSEIEHQLKDARAETLIGLDYLYPEVEKARSALNLKTVLLTSLGDFLPDRPSLQLPPEARIPKQTFASTADFMSFLEASHSGAVNEVSDLANDLALLQYTGGTTGVPKGAMISHYGFALAAVGGAKWFNLTPDDVSLSVSPFFHIMGMIQGMTNALITGGQAVVLTRFVPDVVAEAISLNRCTGWVAAPTMLTALMQLPDMERYDISSFRYICTGGAPIAVEVQRRIKELAPGAVIVEGYGLTESISQGGTVTPLGRYKPGFVGIPNINDVKIVDLESGSVDLDYNQEGEIVIQGPCLMTGYWGRPEATAEAIKVGWLHTGDIGLMDDEGYLKVVGRKKEMMLCSGYNVFPVELENTLYKHPAVAEVAVIGVPDAYRGESPKAFVVLRSDYADSVNEQEILEWCKDNMAAYKRPRLVEFRPELPKSAAGKVLKRILVDEERERPGEANA